MPKLYTYLLACLRPYRLTHLDAYMLEYLTYLLTHLHARRLTGGRVGRQAGSGKPAGRQAGSHDFHTV